MKILQLGKFYPVKGGVEQVMYTLMEGLSERGINCDMLCAALDGPTREIPLNSRARVICAGSIAKVAATMISPAMVRKLRSIVGDYDIVHVHHPDPMSALALFLSGYRGKVVLHWHSDILKQKTLLKFFMPLQRWLLRRADLVIGTTPVYLSESPHLEGIGSKTAVLPIGIEPIAINHASASRLRAEYPGRKIVFSLGRLVPYKGYEYLIRAAAKLPDDYVVLIGGSGPLRDHLDGLIGELGLRSRVSLIENISNEERAAYYGACDVFCLPSVQKTEAFGIVQIEAMSVGCPVVTTDIPGSGVPWVNAHGVSGINVPIEDPDALARAIVSIAGDPDTRARYSLGALNRYRDLFTRPAMIDKCMELYETVLHGKG